MTSINSNWKNPIEAMKIAYGSIPRYNQVTNDEVDTELQRLAKANPNDATVITETYAQRIFAQRPIQFGTQNPYLMIINMIFSHISNKIKAFFNQSKELEKNEIFFLANSLKNHGYITQNQFIQFKISYGDKNEELTNILKNTVSELEKQGKIPKTLFDYLQQLILANDPKTIELLKEGKLITDVQYNQFLTIYKDPKEELKNTLKKIILELYKESKIDRKMYFHLTMLAHQHYPKAVLQFLFGLSSVSNINRFKPELQDIVNPQEQLEMIELLKEAYDHSSFSDRSVKVFSSLTARLEIYRWLKDDEQEESVEKSNLIQTLKDNDPKLFKKAILAYLELRTHCSDPFEKRFFEELILSFKEPKSDNPIIHFSQSLETLSVLKDWQDKVDTLEAALATTESLTADEQIKLVKDLKELYKIFGDILDNEKEWRASPLAMGLQQGLLRSKWREIGNHINRLSNAHDHSLCGCLFDKDLKEAWPDQENIEIKKSSHIPKRDHTHPEKKINVLGVYWNMGNGHRAPMQAIVDYLSHDEFHVSTIDLPQKALLHLDPIHKLAGGDWSSTVLYNNLLAGRHFKWINFIRSASKAPPTQAQIEETKIAIREQILKERPDIIVASYSNNLLLEVAQELGIPLYTQSTDMDIRENVFDDHPDKNVKHFLRGIPHETPEGHQYLDEKGYVDKYRFTGFAVRPEFLTLSEKIKENSGIVAELRQKYKIPADEVVYVISNGGTGGGNPIMELLKKTKQGTIPKGHVFVITGRNKEFRDSLNDFEKYTKAHPNRYNPDITLRIEQEFTSGERLAELLAIAASPTASGQHRGLFIGKPGGSSLGETLAMGTQMLLEPNAFLWEKFAAEKITKLKLGASLTNTSDLVKLVAQETKVPEPKAFVTEDEIQREQEIKALIGPNPEVEIYGIVKKMVQDSEADPEFSNKRCAWKTNGAFMRGIAGKDDALNYFDSIKTLNEMLDKIHHDKPLKQNGTIVSLKPIAINFDTMTLEQTKKYNPKDARLAIRYFINKLKTSDDKEMLIYAEQYLDMVLRFHHDKFNHDPILTRKDPFHRELTMLDRLIGLRKNYPLPKTTERAAPLYRTPLTLSILYDWMEEKTTRGRKKGTDDFIVEDRQAALRAFVKHPEQIDWLNELRLIRAVSAFNQHLKVDENDEILILFEGQETKVSELMKSLTFIGKRIINTQTGVEYFYQHEFGLKAIENDNPKYWRGNLPLFKRKIERKVNDYSLVICTNLGTDPKTGKQEHVWLQFKDPKGQVRSVGRVWDPELNLPKLRITQMLPGQLEAADHYEFLGREALTKKTKIQLNEEQYHKVIAYVEGQSDNLGFNLVNQNCVSFVSDVCRELDLPLPTKAHLAEYLIPIPMSWRKFSVVNPWLRDLVQIPMYPVTLIVNSLMGIFGGSSKNLFSPEQTTALINIDSFFDPRTSLIDAPAQLRAWQEALEDSVPQGVVKDHQGNVVQRTKEQSRIYTLDQVREFSNSIVKIFPDPETPTLI